jgi:hypothetical protein
MESETSNMFISKSGLLMEKVETYWGIDFKIIDGLLELEEEIVSFKD